MPGGEGGEETGVGVRALWCQAGRGKAEEAARVEERKRVRA